MRYSLKWCAVCLVLLMTAVGCSSAADDSAAAEGNGEAEAPAERAEDEGEGAAADEAGAVAEADSAGAQADSQPAAAEDAVPEAPADPNAGLVPGLEYPAVPTSAVAGQAVFAPRAATLASRAEDPTARLDWYSMTVVTPGPVESVLQPEYGDPYSCPNSLIVAVPPNQTAEAGATVVTNRISGLGMGRLQSMGDNGAASIVLFNGSNHISMNRPAGRWWVPASDGAPGTTMFCNTGRREGKVTFIHSTGRQHIVADGFGETSVVPVADCATVPLSAPVEVGAEIRGFALGGMKDLTVTAIDAETGVITASFDWGDETREATFVPGEYTLR